jgi:hypothetical protein
MLVALDNDTKVQDQDYYSTLLIHPAYSWLESFQALKDKLDLDLGVNDQTYYLLKVLELLQLTQNHNLQLDQLDNDTGVTLQNFLASYSI